MTIMLDPAFNSTVMSAQKSSHVTSDDHNTHISLSATKSRGPSQSLTSTKPKVALARPARKDLVLMVSSDRRSTDWWITEQLMVNSSSDETSVTNELCNTGHERRARPDTNLIPFDRNSPLRVAKRRRFHQRSFSTIPLSVGHRSIHETPTLPLSGSKKSGFPLTGYIQRKMKKIFPEN